MVEGCHPFFERLSEYERLMRGFGHFLRGQVPDRCLKLRASLPGRPLSGAVFPRNPYLLHFQGFYPETSRNQCAALLTMGHQACLVRFLAENSLECGDGAGLFERSQWGAGKTLPACLSPGRPSWRSTQRRGPAWMYVRPSLVVWRDYCQSRDAQEKYW